jgi:hypothetical protein
VGPDTELPKRRRKDDGIADDGTHIRFQGIADSADKVRLSVSPTQQVNEIRIRARLSGQSAGDDELAVWVDGTAAANKVGTVLPPKGDTWATQTLSLSTPIGSGRHTIYFGPNQGNDGFIAFDWAEFHGTSTADTTPPTTTIASADLGTTSDNTPTFSFSGSDNVGVTGFDCRVYLQGRTAPSFSSCTSPHTTAVLADGSYTFEVRARDAANNVDATPASDSFSVDATPSGTDTDGDGVADSTDNCDNVQNANQANNDGDSQGDACDTDDDNDGRPDLQDRDPFDPNVQDEPSETGELAYVEGENMDESSTSITQVTDSGATSQTGATLNAARWTNGDTAQESINIQGTANAETVEVMARAVNGGGAFPSVRIFIDGTNFSTDTILDQVTSGTGYQTYTATINEAPGNHTLYAKMADFGTGDNLYIDYIKLSGDAPTPSPDADGDGVADASDNCPSVANARQADTDGDGAGDACDSQGNRDSDGDGVQNYQDDCPNEAGPASNGGCPTSPPPDTTPPAAPTITQGPAEGSTDTDGMVDFAWTGAEAGGSFECSLDRGTPSYGACVSPKHYMGYPDGSYTFRVRQVDDAGNVGAASSLGPTPAAAPEEAPGATPTPTAWPTPTRLATCSGGRGPITAAPTPKARTTTSTAY